MAGFKKICIRYNNAQTHYRPPSDPRAPRFALVLALVEEGLVNSLEVDLVFLPGDVATEGILRVPPGSTIVLITKT